MNQRSRARRHKGSVKQFPRGLEDRKNTPAQQAYRQEVRDFLDSLVDPVAREALEYWRATPSPTFVYFIQQEQGGPVKIGYAVDPQARRSELQCGNPDTLEIRVVILGTGKTERWLHRRWESASVGGEWFGGGYEAAILACAEEIQRQQIEEHRNGFRDSAFLTYELVKSLFESREHWRSVA